MNPRRAAAGAIAVLTALTLISCGEGSGRGGSNQPGVSLPPSAAPGPAGEAQRTSVNESSQQDIAAALRANGVSDEEHWAQIIADNKPYPKEDRSMAKLRQVLAQNHADPETTDKIVNALRP
jgi:hypothetical protein